ncbi:MAG: DNA polymerase III subunit chi [Rickettsiales bacterium]|nr:DNA polymerase III subunit chi [Rickettsiales bacterium]
MQRVVIYKIDENEKVIYNLGFLLEKLCIAGKKIAVFCTEDNIQQIDKALWTFSTNCFVPHDIANANGKNDLQPALLSADLNDFHSREIICVFSLDDLRSLVNNEEIANEINDVIFITHDDLNSVVEQVKNICPVANVDIFKKTQGKWEKAMFWWDAKSRKIIFS